MKILLPLPPSVNHFWSTARSTRWDSRKQRFVTRSVRVLSSAAIQWKTDCAVKLMMQRPRRYETLVSVRIIAYFHDRRGRKRDVDNVTKPILDMLRGYCYADDIQVEEVYLLRKVDAEDPRVEVEVTPYREAAA